VNCITLALSDDRYLFGSLLGGGTNTAIAHVYLGNTTEAIQMSEICTQKIAHFPFVHYRLGTLLG